ncbi:hypothetical protein Y032_0010g868 [Ancylostoma ceylanicum]|uniref:Secreted protein n=1 Tax=Ancylostoma ceylanicum TaxID=53326 RepID=A0A016VG84_9BILA|nr:hypothetical protein Y032_0010g868 [Ancylostoma ceylanicum]
MRCLTTISLIAICICGGVFGRIQDDIPDWSESTGAGDYSGIRDSMPNCRKNSFQHQTSDDRARAGLRVEPERDCAYTSAVASSCRFNLSEIL